MLQGIMVDFGFDSDLRLVATHRIEIFIYYVTLFKSSYHSLEKFSLNHGKGNRDFWFRICKF